VATPQPRVQGRRSRAHGAMNASPLT
jgi:hypothetical protein